MNSPARLLAFLPAPLLCAVVLSANVTETVRETYPLAANGSVRVENVNGRVVIEAWDRNEVSLVAEKSAPDADDLQRMHVVVDAKPDVFAVKTEYDKQHLFSNNNRGEVSYHLKVPAGATLTNVSVVNSDIEVRGITTRVDLYTVNGKIEATGLAAGGRFDTVNGSITVSFDHLAADVSLNTVNGSCRLRVPKDAGFDLRASSLNGSTSCELPVTLERSGHHQLRGVVGGGGPEVTMRSVNGSLAVKTL
jgi:DUF4097 and DUF4098 domain-containing protein YvlB